MKPGKTIMATSTRKSMDKVSKRKSLADQSVDDFLTSFNESDSGESMESPVKKMKGNKKQKVLGKKKLSKSQPKSPGLLAQHKSSLDRLKDQDPEFYEFLQKEDKSLLNFDDSDSDVTDMSDEGEGSDADLDENADSGDEDIDIPESSDEDESAENGHGKVAKQNVKNEKKEKVSKKKKAKETAKQKKVNGKTDKSKKNDNDDDDDDEDFANLDTDTDSDEEMYHKPPEALESMSDDDNEDDAAGKKASKGKGVTMAMIEQWTKRLREQPSPAIIATVAHVLKAAVQRTSRETEETKYTVIGGSAFNAVVKMCLVDMPPALHKLLNLKPSTDLQKPAMPSKDDKRWIKIRSHVKSYLQDILKLMSDISEVSMVNVLLKHIHKLVAFYAADPRLVKAVMKKSISIWSTGEETSRVMAFLIINRLIKINQELSLEDCIKKLYMAYVKNCKFTSPNTLPQINFMQRSYVEIVTLDVELAYQYAFMYIRQLAIHLRNATSIKKKESVQAVYNWQYIHCLTLWSRVMSLTYPNEVLEPLIYPLVQTIIGTIKLIPTQRYYPLRFHCVQALTMISKATNIYIPVLPFLLEVFEQTDFNKRHKAINFKPFNFACILKFSKPQLQERAFKDGIIDQLYELMLEFFATQAHTVGFPELVLPSQLQLKEFMKKCKVGNFTKQIKQIYDKVTENSLFITAKRNKTAFSLSDTKAIDLWERQCKETGTPIGKYYISWRKLRDRELMHQIANKEQIVGEATVPEVVRSGPHKPTAEDKKEFGALFDSDSDDEKIDFSESFLPPDEKRDLKIERKKIAAATKKAGAQKKTTQESDDENYSDFDSDELEQLAGSGDDDDDEEEEDDDAVDVKEEEDSDHEESDVEDDEVESDDDDDDVDEKADIVEDFTMSSDED